MNLFWNALLILFAAIDFFMWFYPPPEPIFPVELNLFCGILLVNLVIFNFIKYNNDQS